MNEDTPFGASWRSVKCIECGMTRGEIKNTREPCTERFGVTPKHRFNEPEAPRAGTFAEPPAVNLAEVNAAESFRRQQEHAGWREHRCGNCYIPGFGRSAIRCPNDTTEPPAPEIDFEIPHDFGCPGCKEQRIVGAADDARHDREMEQELMAA